MQEHEYNFFSESQQESGWFVQKKPKDNNGCNGHFNGLDHGSIRHWVGDYCGCDGSSPEPVPIDGIVPYLIGAAIILTLTFRKKLAR